MADGVDPHDENDDRFAVGNEKGGADEPADQAHRHLTDEQGRHLGPGLEIVPAEHDLHRISHQDCLHGGVGQGRDSRDHQHHKQESVELNGTPSR